MQGIDTFIEFVKKDIAIKSEAIRLCENSNSEEEKLVILSTLLLKMKNEYDSREGQQNIMDV